MDHLPAAMARVLARFAPAFHAPVWARAQVLLVGALLAPGTRTVASALRVMGLAQNRHFGSYHRVLSRATWSSLDLSRTLFRLLVETFVPAGEPVVVGLDETLERRRGAKISVKGLYRDHARSSRSIRVSSQGIRWISLMLLTPVGWAKRVWALPFLTVLVPSAAHCAKHGRRYKTLAHWGRLAIVQVGRWLGNRRLVVVADNNYSALELLERARRAGATVVTRLRLDAALYDPAPTPEEFRRLHPRGTIPCHGARQPTLQARLDDPSTPWRRQRVCWYGGVEREVETVTGTSVWYRSPLPPVPIRWLLVRDPRGQLDPMALLCTDPEVKPEQILGWFLLRWQVEVTFAEARAHLGVETQRQWSPKAIERTTPALFGLFSLVPLCAREMLQLDPLPARRAAWYPKQEPTFSDALAYVRQQLWPVTINQRSAPDEDVVMIPRALLLRFTDALAFAA